MGRVCSVIREGRYCLRPNLKCHFSGIPARYPGRRQWIRVVFIGHPAVFRSIHVLLGTQYFLPSSLFFFWCSWTSLSPSVRLFCWTYFQGFRSTWRLWMVRGDVPILFLSWSFLFLFVRRFLGRLRVFSGFSAFLRIPVLSESRLQFPAEETGWKPSHLGCPRVPASRQLAHPGSKPSHLGCPRVSASRQMAHPGWKPCHLEAGSSTTSKGSSGTDRSAAPSGHPFALKLQECASKSASSSGVSGWISWGGRVPWREGKPRRHLVRRAPGQQASTQLGGKKRNTVCLRAGPCAGGVTAKQNPETSSLFYFPPFF